MTSQVVPQMAVGTKKSTSVLPVMGRVSVGVAGTAGMDGGT
jgi:hypothetical protein